MKRAGTAGFCTMEEPGGSVVRLEAGGGFGKHIKLS